MQQKYAGPIIRRYVGYNVTGQVTL